MSNINWLEIKNEYINTNTSYRKLSEKYGASLTAVKTHAKNENWGKLRNNQRHKIETKVTQKAADTIIKKEIDRLTKISDIADSLLDKLEEATAQLNNHLLTNRKKVKVVQYNDLNKPTKETITDTEEKIFIVGDIDKIGLKQLTAALKDLRDVCAPQDGKESGGIAPIIIKNDLDEEDYYNLNDRAV